MRRGKLGPLRPKIISNAGIASSGPIRSEMPGTIAYVEVPDIKAAYAKALKSGAKEMLPPMSIPLVLPLRFFAVAPPPRKRLSGNPDSDLRSLIAVVPAQVGTQEFQSLALVPAFAGATIGEMPPI